MCLACSSSLPACLRRILHILQVHVRTFLAIADQRPSPAPDRLYEDATTLMAQASTLEKGPTDEAWTAVTELWPVLKDMDGARLVLTTSRGK